MKAEINIHKRRMYIVFALLFGLCYWQWHFVWEGIISNFYLNGSIIGTFLFGGYLAFKSFGGLHNEVVAFGALQEAYADIHKSREIAEEDPFWRHYRCLEAGVVFKRPKLLGHVYELTVEELLRTKHMRISISTMQNLTAAIDQKMAHERALLQYLTGLLVFLGLIGTFIGLMEMVGSVGGIIGSLAGAGGEAPGGPDPFKKLLHDLEAPLVGMALGFSGSLFGLFTSLVLGLITRFVNSATYVVKEEFEAWLVGITQIERNDDADGVGSYGGGDSQSNIYKSITSGLETSLSTGLAAGFTAGFADVGPALRSAHLSFDRTVEAINRLVVAQEEQQKNLANTTKLLQTLIERNGFAAPLSGSGVELDVSALQTLRNEMLLLGTTIASQLDGGLSKLEETVKAQKSPEIQALIQLNNQQQELVRHSQAMEERFARRLGDLAATIGDSHRAQITTLEEVALQQQAVTRLTEATHAAVTATLNDVAGVMERVNVAQVDNNRIVADLRQEVTGGMRELTGRPDPSKMIEAATTTIDKNLRDGLTHIGRLTEGALGAVSTGISRLEGKQADAIEKINRLPDRTILAGEMHNLASAIDARMASGFADVARTIENVFVSYAELLGHVGPARASSNPSPAPQPAPYNPRTSPQVNVQFNQQPFGRQAAQGAPGPSPSAANPQAQANQHPETDMNQKAQLLRAAVQAKLPQILDTSR